MRMLLFVPALFFFMLPLARCAIIKRAQRRKTAAIEAAAIAKAKAEAESKAIRDAAKAATLMTLLPPEKPKGKRGRPRKKPQEQRDAKKRPVIIPEPATETSSSVMVHDEEPAPETQGASAVMRPENTSQLQPATPALVPKPTLSIRGNNIFVGHVVSFTGKLSCMKRWDAIDAVRKNGGTSHDSFAVGTTLLVVGKKPSEKKLKMAAERKDKIRVISPEEFYIMLQMPLTLEADEFEVFVRSRLSHNNAHKEVRS